MGFVPAEARRRPALSSSSASVLRRRTTSRRASATSAQISVPTSTSDCMNSGFTSSPRRGVAASISVSMCARRRPSASTIWYSSSTPRVSQPPSFTCEDLAPELVLGSLILGDRPALGDLAVRDMEHVDGLRRQRLALTLGGRGRQDDRVLVVREDGVPLDLEGAAGELDELAEEPEDLVD